MTDLYIPYAAPYLADETTHFGVRNDATFVNCTDNPYAYWGLFSILWQRAQAFIICEHDIIPTDEQLAELRDCGAAWCVFDYDRLGSTVASLGFSRFDPAQLAEYIAAEQWGAMRLTQESIEHLREQATPALTASIPWNQVDGAVFTFLTTRGYTPHRHGTVAHSRARRAVEV